MVKKRKILVIDDEEIIRDLIKMILEEEEYSIFTAENGINGFKIIEKEVPDLILLDIVMPEMEGIEFLRIMKKKEINIPVIIMSGNPIGVQHLKISELLGARASLQKPFKKSDLIEIIEKI